MKVLVCDDEAQVREQLKRAVDEILGAGSCAAVSYTHLDCSASNFFPDAMLSG